MKKKFFKILFLNILFIISILLITEIIFSVILIKEEWHYELYEKNSNLTLKKFFNTYVNGFNEQYIKKDLNSFFSIDDFQKPSIGKYYKDKNIILMGGSFTHGYNVDYEDSFGFILAEYLKNYAIYNAGINAASPREMLYILRNYNEYSKDNILPKDTNSTKYVIYTYISDHNRRLLNNVWRISPNFEKYKTLTGKEHLRFYKTGNVLRKSFIYHFYERHYNPKGSIRLNNLFTFYMKEIKQEIDKKFPNAQFVILVFIDNSSYNWQTLEDDGIKIIKLHDISKIDFDSVEYRTSDGTHPNGYAWRTIVPLLTRKLDL